LLLHGLEYPNIQYGNSLARKLSEIGDADRVDVILTNPPFGGEEEATIKNNFPANLQTAETALLFLQVIMRRLRRLGRGPSPESGGRAAIVVPDGTLFADGVAARIKAQLLREYNLHTIVRLPNGVFAPYTTIPTNLLFFDRSHPTEEIWYYQVLPPEGRKNYSKTKPMQFEEFADCIKWWPHDQREENQHAWRVKASDIIKTDDNGTVLSVNLDIKNPNSAETLEHEEPSVLIDRLVEGEEELLKLLQEMKDIVDAGRE
jgi:type I restriction enzyme M protein